LVDDCIPKNSYFEKWEISLLEKEFLRIYGLRLEINEIAKQDGASEKEIIQFINQEITKHFVEKEQKYGEQIMRRIEKQIFLITLDAEWKDHLFSLDKLRQSINLRAYAQKDPLIEYKKEGFNMFEDMMLRVEEQLISRLSHVEIAISSNEGEVNLIAQSQKPKTFESRIDPNFSPQKNENVKVPTAPIRNHVDPANRDPRDVSTWGQVGRNEPCPCGSGKKYKNCHGA